MSEKRKDYTDKMTGKMIKNIKQPDSDIIPAQQVTTMQKRILLEISDAISILRRLEERSKSQSSDSEPIRTGKLNKIMSLFTPLNFYRVTTIVLLFLCFWLSVSYYCDVWISEDSWARRAYDAAEKLNDPKPGIQYIRVRLLFDEGKKKSAQALTLDLEAQADALKDEEAKQ